MSFIGQASNKPHNPEQSLQVVNDDLPIQKSPNHSHAVSSKPEDEDFKSFVTTMLLQLKAKVDKNELEIEQLWLLTVKNASNNDIIKKMEEQQKEISSLKETIRQFEASLHRKFYNQACAADAQLERFEKNLNRKLDSLQRQGDSIERQNLNLAGHLNPPDPRKDAHALQEEARRREIQERSRPPQRQFSRKRPRGEDWFNCSKQPKPAQSSRGEHREPKKLKARQLFDNMDLSQPPEE